MKRLGDVIDNININEDYSKLVAYIPSRGLLGLLPEINVLTNGDLKFESEFFEF